MRKNAVETHDLTRKFGDFTAVDRVNFYIPEGEIFGLLGPNGAGKTTTIRMLCGILRPTGGNAFVLGYNATREAETIKSRIGYMSQKFSLYNDLTAYENLMFYASIYGVPSEIRAKRIAELIELSGLRGVEQEQTRNLSGAWRQRLALACAIAHKPPMLFLDEATAGVDPVSRREFWDLIYQMAGEGISVLATTHYMDEAEYCNTVGLMHQSKLIAVRSPDSLKESLDGVLFELACDKGNQAVTVLDQLPGVIDAAMHGVRVHVLLEKAILRGRIERVLRRNGIQIYGIEEVLPSLEDVFISMVEKEDRKSVRTEMTERE
jgi:ABC-2 type transport system ATP-binding protein